MSTFSKRHYEKIAAALKRCDETFEEVSGEAPTQVQDFLHQAVHEVRMEFVKVFEEDNPRFDRDLFLTNSYTDEVRGLLDLIEPHVPPGGSFPAHNIEYQR